MAAEANSMKQRHMAHSFVRVRLCVKLLEGAQIIFWLRPCMLKQCGIYEKRQHQVRKRRINSM